MKVVDAKTWAGQPVVRFENVGIRYGMDAEVLRDLTFSLEPG